MKWCINHPYQAKHNWKLLNLAGLNPRNNSYKPLCAAIIAPPEQDVQNVVGILESKYLNPFDIALNEKELYNLSFGIQLKGQVDRSFGIATEKKRIWDRKVLNDSEKRIFSKDLRLHQPIKLNEIPLFISSITKITLEKENNKRQLMQPKFISLGSCYHYQLKPTD